MALTRRDFLGAGAAGLISASSLSRIEADESPRNIIFCVSDGMPASTLSMADQFLWLTAGRRSYWARLMSQEGVVNGLQETRSLSSIVTDSSAASSAWGSGRHIWNGQVNMFPDGTALRPIASVMRAGGIRVGLVTTTTITHATPAGFGVSCAGRERQADIARLYLKAGIEVLMGGGDRFFDPGAREDGRDLYAEYAKAGYAVIKKRTGLSGKLGQKVLGVFSSSHLPMSVDRADSPKLAAEVPTLAEMAGKAIGILDKGPKGFLLQIEGGRVDHGNHENDLAGAIYDQIAFEEAVKVAVDFARSKGDTLVVITADHATGGPSLNGAGQEYFDSTAGIKLVAGMRASFEALRGLLKAGIGPRRAGEIIEDRLGVKLTAGEASLLSDAIERKWPAGLSVFEGSLGSVLGILVGNHTKVQWTSQNHTSDHVPLTALGPGASRFRGLIENVRMFDIMLGLKGLSWSNPSMSFSEAARHYQKLRLGTLSGG